LTTDENGMINNDATVWIFYSEMKSLSTFAFSNEEEKCLIIEIS
jgi:hypothetical protein